VKRTAVILTATLLFVAAVVLLHGGARIVRGPQAGSWVFPRSGPTVVGFWSPGPARLFLDGELVAEGSGVRQERVVAEAGPHALRFEAPDGARLLWHPPGRRGSLEYVSSLDGATPWGDALAATAIFAALTAAFVLLARPSRPSPPILVAFGLAFAARAALAIHGGQTWDEDEYWAAGRNYLVNLLDGDFSRRWWLWNHEHPPVTKYLAGLGALWHDGYLGAKLLFALLGAGTAALVAAITQRLFESRTAAFTAGVVAALLPHLVAHGAIVGHETPSLFFGTLAVWLALRERLVLAGVALGLALGTRYLNLTMAPVVVLAAVLAAPRLRPAALAAVVIPVVAFVVVVAISPPLWDDLLHTWHAAQEIAKRPAVPEWFLGAHRDRMPRWYFAIYLVVTTPIGILVAALAGPWFARQKRAWLLLLVWVACSLAVGLSPIRRDGIRYALAAFVPMAIAAGGFAHRRRIVPLVLGVYLAAQLVWVWPYPLDYYAEPIGAGRAQARRWFEVGWWGEGVTEAVAWVNQHAPPNARVGRSVVPTHITWFRGDLWGDVVDRPAPQRDVVVWNPAWQDFYGAPDVTGLRLAHEIRVQGAVLARIYLRE
jgi:Dolichyl-phosphate-mannose-protein mannosyltransferase